MILRKDLMQLKVPSMQILLHFGRQEPSIKGGLNLLSDNQKEAMYP
jgi:hypothetical protein